MATIEEYAELAKLCEAAQAATQAAYRYARDTGLYFEMPSITRDDDDPEYEPSFDTSWEMSEGC